MGEEDSYARRDEGGCEECPCCEGGRYLRGQRGGDTGKEEGTGGDERGAG
jgi:hypothetical protein